MKTSKVSTAAFLAGVTTLAVSLPVLAEQRNFDLSDFDEISISDGLDAEVEIGDNFSVSAEANSDRTLDRLDIRVRGDRLVIEREASWTDWSIFAARRDAVVSVTLPVLESLDASAGTDVSVGGDFGDGMQVEASSGSSVRLDDVNGGEYVLDASSGADIDADGTCDELEVRVSSGADVDADKLICKDVDAAASSGGNARVHASESVVADASSGGDVRVYGAPKVVEKSESSGGDVRIDD